jgi:flagellar biosynthesis anti-sigma factor FlgM
MISGIQGPPGRTPVELTDQTTNKATETDKGLAHPNNTAVRLGTRDTVSLTDQAAQLRALEGQIAHQPAVDTQRVNEAQRAFATGSYNIDPSQVADKLLRFELGLASVQ